MHGIPGLGLRAIEKKIKTRGVPSNKSRRRQGRGGRVQIAAAKQDVHVTGIPHRRFIDGRNPGRHGIAAHHRVRNPCLLQSRAGTQQAFAHFFHGADHPFPGDVGSTGTGHSGIVSRGAAERLITDQPGAGKWPANGRLDKTWFEL